MKRRDNDSKQKNASKRRRVSKACDSCRHKKAKCDGLNPCTSCSSNQEKCIYSETSKKRGIPSGYTKDLETKNFMLQLLLTKLFSEDPNIEDKLVKLLTEESLKSELIQQFENLTELWQNGCQIKSLLNQFIDKDLSKSNVDLKTISSVLSNDQLQTHIDPNKKIRILLTNCQPKDEQISSIQQDQIQQSFLPNVPEQNHQYNSFENNYHIHLLLNQQQQAVNELQTQQFFKSQMGFVGNMNVPSPDYHTATSSALNIPPDHNNQMNPQLYINQQHPITNDPANNHTLHQRNYNNQLPNEFNVRSGQTGSIEPQYLDQYFEDQKKRFT